MQTYGWQDWVKNGEMAGTSGEAKRLEAIEIKLVEKPKPVPPEVLKVRRLLRTFPQILALEVLF